MKPQQWTFKTKAGDFVRVCFNARKSETLAAPPMVRARLSGPILVTATCANAVRVGEQWTKRWVRVNPKT